MSSADTSPRFDPEELGAHLVAMPVDRLHHSHGRGYRYAMGEYPETPQADLEVYPDSGMIRYTSEGTHIAMTDKDVSVQFTDEGVLFDSRTDNEHRTLVISSMGEAMLVVSRPGLNSEDRQVEGFLKARDAEIVEDSSQSHAPEISEPSQQIAPWEEPEPATQTPQPEQQAATNTKPETVSGDRIVVTGRAGRAPRLAETKGGVPVARFPLAEHGIDESGNEVTIWHAVLAFRDRAHDVMDTVKKGETYKVAGYRHVKVKPDGKEEAEIIAASVRPPSNKNGGVK